MPQILIAQNFNANKGDSAVAHAMIRSLRAICPGISVCLTSYDPESASHEYRVPAFEWLLSFRGARLSASRSKKALLLLRELLWACYSVFWAMLYRFSQFELPLPRSKRGTVWAYMHSDVIALPGGHFFTTLNSIATNLSHLYALAFAMALGRKTMIFAQTLGPFRGASGAILECATRTLLKRVSCVTLRDEASVRAYPDLSARLTAEVVFALDPPISAAASSLVASVRRPPGPVVGVTIHHLYYRHFFTRPEYVSLMASIFDWIVSETGGTVLIIPMEDVCHAGGDRDIAREMIAASMVPDRIILHTDNMDALATMSLVAAVDVLVATKTHSVVFGLVASVPTISISYHAKSTEFMRSCGVGEYAIDLQYLSLPVFTRAFRRLASNPTEIRTRQRAAIECIRMRSQENALMLLSLAGAIREYSPPPRVEAVS